VFTLASLPQAALAQIELSDLLRAQGRCEQAVEAYQRYLESFTDPVGLRHAQYSKAWCLWDLQRYAEAATAFEKAYDLLRNQSLREQALVKSADAYFMNAQYRLAGAAYEKALAEFARSPGRPAMLAQAAESYARAADGTNTVRLLATIIAENPQSEDAMTAQLRLARFHEDQRAWADALAAYDLFLSTYSASERYADALLARGLLRYRMQAYDDALADFERLMSEMAGTTWAERAYFMRGWCHYQKGDVRRAIDIGRSFLAKHPESTWAADVTFWLAEHDFNVQQYGVAETNFAALASFQPTNALADRALYWAGRSAFEQKAFARAIDHYGQLIRLYTNSPMIPEARFAQGDSLTEIGDFAGAILAFDEIIRKFPAHPLVVRALGRIGDCQFTLGADRADRYNEAAASYRAALTHPQIAPDLALQVEYKLARTYERLGRNDDAVTHYLNVVYQWMARRAEAEVPPEEIWFVRAAFSAAALREAGGAAADAAKIYRRVIDAGVAAAPDAALRLERLEGRKADSTTVPETRNMPAE
jgi:outer membrane protein assembly factor BamD (BamD/ComL family)